MRIAIGVLLSFTILFLAQPGLGADQKTNGSACADKVTAVSGTPDYSNLQTPARELRLARPSQKLMLTLNSSLDPEIIMQNLLANNLRIELFILESDGRLYENSDFFTTKEKRGLAEFNENVEALEDMIGDYSDSVNYLQEAIKIKASPKLIAWLRNYNAQMHAQFLVTLEKGGWLPTNPRYLARYSRFVKIISKIEGRAQDDFLLDEIASDLEKDAATEFDIHNLESGIHRLRRHLRWFMLKIQSMNGLIQIKENDGGVVWNHPKLETERVEKYSNITVIGQQKRVVRIKRSLFQSVANMVDVLGLAKDTGQFEEIYVRGLLESGVASNKKEAKMMAIDLVSRRADEVTVDPTAVCDDAQKFLQKYQVREKIAKEIRRALP